MSYKDTVREKEVKFLSLYKRLKKKISIILVMTRQDSVRALEAEGFISKSQIQFRGKDRQIPYY